MLFVHDDQAGVAQGCKNSGAGADNDMGTAVAGRFPGTIPLCIAQSRVKNSDVGTKSLPEAVQGLGCQADFGDKHQGLFTALQAIGYQLQIDFGLTTAGDALQQVADKPCRGF